MVTEAERKPSEADLYEFQSEDEDGHKMQPGKIPYIYWSTYMDQHASFWNMNI